MKAAITQLGRGSCSHLETWQELKKIPVHELAYGTQSPMLAVTPPSLIFYPHPQTPAPPGRSLTHVGPPRTGSSLVPSCHQCRARHNESPLWLVPASLQSQELVLGNTEACPAKSALSGSQLFHACLSPYWGKMFLKDMRSHTLLL